MLLNASGEIGTSIGALNVGRRPLSAGQSSERLNPWIGNLSYLSRLENARHQGFVISSAPTIGADGRNEGALGGRQPEVA